MKLTKLCDITVMGKPQPGGSKRAFVPRNKEGNPIPNGRGGVIANVIDANPNAKEWQREVKHEARKIMGAIPPTDVALFAKVSFFVLRPKGHFGTGKNANVLKSSAPSFPVTKPDATKLWRCVEDALTGIVWRDDAQIVQQQVSKSYGPQAGVRVEIFRAEPEDLPFNLNYRIVRE